MVENWQDQVVERLARLDAENRLLRCKARWMGRGGFTSLAGLIVAAAGGPAMLANPEVTPGKIILKDPGGSLNAVVLKADAMGASVSVWDGNGRRRADLGGSAVSQALVLTDPNGKENLLQ